MPPVVALVAFLLWACALAPAQSTPPFHPAPDRLQLPDGVNFGPVSAVALDGAGNLFVLNRGPHPLLEFAPDGRFVRFLAEGFLQRPHGLRIGPDGNLWVTDVRAHGVFKLSPSGRILLVLGGGGTAGDFNERFKAPLLNEPTDVAFGPSGEIYVAEGHGGDAGRIRKFDRDGNFVKSWGKKGSQPGEFLTPHSILVGPDGLVYVVDRENQRIQIFDADGNLKNTWTGVGWPNALIAAPGGGFYSTDANGGRILKLDRDGKVQGAIGSLGKAPGQFGEAHAIALDRSGNLYVADTLNWRVQKFTPSK